MTTPSFSDDMPTEATEEHRDPSNLPLLFLAVCLVGGVVAAMAFRSLPVEQESEAEIHLKALQLEPLVGTPEPATLDSLRGKVALVNFWGTWCGPCMIEFPHLVSMSKRLSSHPDFVFLPVSCGATLENETSDLLQGATETYLSRVKFDLPVYYDPQAVTRLGLMRDAELDGFSYPTTILLDRQGVIRGIWVGYRAGIEADVQATVESLLSEPS